MRIKQLSARNIKGFDGAYTFEPGDVTVLSGVNGGGKTTHLSLVLGLFGKANARMLKAGATDGEIRAVISADEGEETWEIGRAFAPGKVSTPTVKSSTGTGKMGAPAKFLQTILDLVSIDPIGQAMTAPEDRQAEILLETIKLDIDPAELKNAVNGLSIPGLATVVKNAERMQGLDALKSVGDHVYARRTDVNRSAKEKRAHCAQLRESAGPDESTDWSAEASSAGEELRALEQNEQKQLREADAGSAEVRLEVEQAANQKAKAVAEEHLEAVRALEKERDVKLAAIVKKQAEDVATLEVAHRGLISQITDANKEPRETLAGKKAAAMEKALASERASQTREIADQADRDAAALESQSAGMTTALSALDAVREKLLASLPIKGLTVENGIPYLNGVPLSEVNTEQRAMFWVKVAAMRAADLGIVCFDGAECLDPKNFEAFVSAAKQTGLQWFIGRVDGGPFRIEKF